MNYCGGHADEPIQPRQAARLQAAEDHLEGRAHQEPTPVWSDTRCGSDPTMPRLRWEPDFPGASSMTQRGAMGGPPGRTQAKIERIARKNAELLHEELELGVHMLKDGRVRVYLLDRGWRRWPYREYHSAESA